MNHPTCPGRLPFCSIRQLFSKADIIILGWEKMNMAFVRVWVKEGKN